MEPSRRCADVQSGGPVRPETLHCLLHSRPRVLGYALTRVIHGSDRDLVPLTLHVRVGCYAWLWVQHTHPLQAYRAAYTLTCCAAHFVMRLCAFIAVAAQCNCWRPVCQHSSASSGRSVRCCRLVVTGQATAAGDGHDMAGS